MYYKHYVCTLNSFKNINSTKNIHI